MKNFGLLCKKVGMVQHDCDGKFIPLTLLHVEDPVVVGFKTLNRDGYSAVILGFGYSKLKSWNKQQHGLVSNDARVVAKIKEFRVNDLSKFTLGEAVKVSDFFKLDDLVDIQGYTLGRGFTGPMKRWGFSGLRATHGVSRSHRSHGSTGTRDQSRVFKNKKMAGRYGNEKVTIKNVKLKYLEEESNIAKNGSIIGVYGAVPGYKGAYCSVFKSVSKGELL
ncbi:MAG: 50S ribosomal protein L3 [Alphaproteobacteria bacterium]|nr:MAG: 50S ribosomal protein L3 [Alphaproteobacteria bacterium]